MRIITWALATQRGVPYNPRYPFGEIQSYFNWIGEYKAVQYVRINDYNAARIKIINMPVSVMQTDIGRFTMKISSYFNFAMNSYWCCRATNHETFHMSGGGSHLPQPHVMATDGGTVGNFTERDCNYISVYPWKSNRRPWLEPNAMRDKFSKRTANDYRQWTSRSSSPGRGDPPSISSGFPPEEVVLPEGYQCRSGLIVTMDNIELDTTPMFMDNEMDISSLELPTYDHWLFP